MAISALGYLGIRSDRLEDWSDFAGSLLGMMKIDRSATALAFRMDDRIQRLLVSDEPGDTLAFMGWEVETGHDLQLLDRIHQSSHDFREALARDCGPSVAF